MVSDKADFRLRQAIPLRTPSLAAVPPRIDLLAMRHIAFAVLCVLGMLPVLVEAQVVVAPYMHYAVVNETCPVCGQGRILIASDKNGHSLFVLCEDCESEWDKPSESHNASVANRDRHTFSRYLQPDELTDHPWYSQILNR